MASVEIKSSKVQEYKNLGRYFYAELASGKHEITVAIAPDHVQVVLTSNAALRAWRTLGKTFRTMELAQAHYKTPEIRAMLAQAVDLNEASKLAESVARAALLEGACA